MYLVVHAARRNCHGVARSTAAAAAAATSKEWYSTGTAQIQIPAAISFGEVDIRVGRIINAAKHPQSDKLFVEQIDVGEDEPRQIVSGLQAYYTADELLDRTVLVVCNLPKAKLAGEASVGMVLCASNAHESESESNGDGDGNGGEGDAGARKVEFVDPPESAEPGTAIVVEGVEQKFASISRMKKKKIWAAIQSELKVAEGGVPVWNGKVLVAEGHGPCTRGDAAVAIYDVDTERAMSVKLAAWGTA
eukprot:gene9974-4249_t